ncbi:Proteasome activator complex subunit 4 [Bienertia sinuspersici]
MSTKKLNFQKSEKKWDSGCFICKGPHLARNCPKKERLSAIIMEEGDDDKLSTKKLNFQKSEKKWDSGCFICKGPHLARNCPKKERLSAIIMEEGDHDTSKDDDLSPRMGSMKLLDGDHTPQM